MFFRREFPALRRSKRQWFNTSVRVFTERGPIEAVGINLSDGGMGMFAVAHLPVGLSVQVEFRPPHSSAAVRLPATIRHRALYLYGIEFSSEVDDRRQSAAADALGFSTHH